MGGVPSSSQRGNGRGGRSPLSHPGAEQRGWERDSAGSARPSVKGSPMPLFSLQVSPSVLSSLSHCTTAVTGCRARDWAMLGATTPRPEPPLCGTGGLGAAPQREGRLGLCYSQPGAGTPSRGWAAAGMRVAPPRYRFKGARAG